MYLSKAEIDQIFLEFVLPVTQKKEGEKLWQSA